jgi:Peptidase inhibitor family I36
LKRTLAGAAVAASFAVTLLGATGAASAAPRHDDAARHGQAGVVEPRSIEQCTDGRICVWQEPYFKGNWTSLTPQHPGECQPIYGGGWSYFNNTTVLERVWSGSNCTGISEIVFRRHEVPQEGFVVNSVGGYP